jgi:hypothetical protein
MDPSTVIAGKKRVEDARERAYDPAIRPSLQKASCEEGGCAGQARHDYSQLWCVFAWLAIPVFIRGSNR